MTDPRRTISDAAARLIAEKGYSATSLQEVAEAVSITKAGVYHYFGTKQALFEYIVLNTLDEMLRGAQAASSSATEPGEKLIAFMKAHASYFEANRTRYMASFFGLGGDEGGEYSADQLGRRRAYVGVLEKLLSDGQADGTFAVEDVSVLSRGVLGMLNWMARWHRPDGPKSAPEVAEAYATVLLRGISRN